MEGGKGNGDGIKNIPVEFVEHRGPRGLNIGTIVGGARDDLVGTASVAGTVGCGGPLGISTELGKDRG